MLAISLCILSFAFAIAMQAIHRARDQKFHWSDKIHHEPLIGQSHQFTELRRADLRSSAARAPNDEPLARKRCDRPHSFGLKIQNQHMQPSPRCIGWQHLEDFNDPEVPKETERKKKKTRNAPPRRHAPLHPVSSMTFIFPFGFFSSGEVFPIFSSFDIVGNLFLPSKRTHRAESSSMSFVWLCADKTVPGVSLLHSVIQAGRYQSTARLRLQTTRVGVRGWRTHRISATTRE